MLAYLDHQATTPCDPAVVAAMAPWWTEQFANPASRLHRPGLLAAAAVDQARTQILGQLGLTAGAPPENPRGHQGDAQLIFTSGATEANNLALKGLAEAELAAGGNRRQLVTLATEHRAVLDPLRYLARHGFRLSELPVGSDGLVDLDQLAAALGPDTLVVSVMAANNEIGVLQPLAAIGSLCRQRGIPFHCDGAQAVGHIALNPAELGEVGLDATAQSQSAPFGLSGFDGGTEDSSSFLLHRSPMAGGLNAQLRLGVLVEVADREGGHRCLPLALKALLSTLRPQGATRTSEPESAVVWLPGAAVIV